METKQVHVKLTSIITQQETQTIIKNYTGQTIVKNNSHYIRFSDEHSGQNTVKIDIKDNLVTCLFEKHATRRIVFQNGEQSVLHYQLPQGVMTFLVDTTQLYWQTNDRGDIIQLDLYYTLYQEDTVFGKYHLTYEITF